MNITIQYITKSFHSVSVEKTPSNHRMTIKCRDPYTGKMEGIVMNLTKDELEHFVGAAGLVLADI